MSLIKVKIVTVACLFPVLLAFNTNADIIYFKDGLKTICQEKAWEENGQVKCEYGGWIINYHKSDVLRILPTSPPKHAVRPEIPQKAAKKTTPAQGVTPKASRANIDSLTFYSPRRPYKYWTDKSTKHQSYQEAIQALAKEYERSPEWVQQNMGQTNNLSEIHQNLRTRRSAESSE